MPSEYQTLLEHASHVLLPQAALMHGGLSADPGETDSTKLLEVWRARLTAFHNQFLTPAGALRKRLELALASAPLPQSC